jgi:hypothetical protein
MHINISICKSLASCFFDFDTFPRDTFSKELAHNGAFDLCASTKCQKLGLRALADCAPDFADCVSAASKFLPGAESMIYERALCLRRAQNLRYAPKLPPVTQKDADTRI